MIKKTMDDSEFFTANFPQKAQKEKVYKNMEKIIKYKIAVLRLDAWTQIPYSKNNE